MRKTIVITGTTHGIGRVAAFELARAARHVIMLVRDVEAGGQLRHEIAAAVAGAEIDVVHCDLASFASVRRAADAVRALVPALDCLINNAGMVSMRRAASVDG